jgi:integrase
MPMPIRELFDRYTTLKGLDRKSVALYLMLADRLDRFCGRPVTTDDLDDLAMSRYLRWRAETPGWRGRLPAAATVKKDQSMIQAAWKYAARKKITSEFPDLAPVKVPKKIPTGRAYTIEDVSKLVRRARRRFGRTGGLPSSWWWSTIIYAAVTTGERFTAISSVRWADVDLERRRILFRGENRKNKTRDLERQITAELADMLAEHRGPDDALVWPWDRRSRSQWASLQVLCRTAGVKYRGFHGFRRTAASYAALMGGRAAATRLLDHSDPNLQAVYVDSLICPDEESSCAALPPLDLEDRPPGPPAPAA